MIAARDDRTASAGHVLRNGKPGHALCGYSDVGMAKTGGAKQAAGKRITLPDGRNVPMNNGSTGFFVARPHYFQCTESLSSRYTRPHYCCAYAEQTAALIVISSLL